MPAPVDFAGRLTQAPLLWVLSSRRLAETIVFIRWVSCCRTVSSQSFSVPPEPSRRLVGLEGRGASQLISGFSFWSVSSWFFRESIVFSLGQPAIRRRFRKIARQHYDVFGSGRGTSTLNLQSGLLWPRGASEGAPFQSLLAHIRKAFLFSGTEALSRASRR